MHFIILCLIFYVEINIVSESKHIEQILQILIQRDKMYKNAIFGNYFVYTLIRKFAEKNWRHSERNSVGTDSFTSQPGQSGHIRNWVRPGIALCTIRLQRGLSATRIASV